MAESTVRWFVVREKHCWMVSCMWALSRWYAWSINGSCSINPMSLGHHVDGVKPLVVQWSGNTYYQEFRMPSSVVAQTGVFPWSLCSGLTIHHPSLSLVTSSPVLSSGAKGHHLSACLQSWEAVCGLSSSHWNDTHYSCTQRDLDAELLISSSSNQEICDGFIFWRQCSHHPSSVSAVYY